MCVLGRSVRGAVPGARCVPPVRAGRVSGRGADTDVAVRRPAPGQQDLGHDGKIRELPVEVDVEVSLSHSADREFLQSGHPASLSSRVHACLRVYVCVVHVCLCVYWYDKVQF